VNRLDSLISLKKQQKENFEKIFDDFKKIATDRFLMVYQDHYDVPSFSIINILLEDDNPQSDAFVQWVNSELIIIEPEQKHLGISMMKNINALEKWLLEKID